MTNHEKDCSANAVVVFDEAIASVYITPELTSSCRQHLPVSANHYITVAHHNMATDIDDEEENTEDSSGKITSSFNDRGIWPHKMDFLLSCLSYAVGLGNVWRFPYLCYRNGGGAFLIPFIIMLFICGIPLVFLELAFGQFASSGVVSSWKVCPLFQGVGWGMFLVSILIAIYYNMIIAWTLHYLFASFTSVLPWNSCGDWSTEACSHVTPAHIKNCTSINGTWYNSTCYTVVQYGAAVYKQIAALANGTDPLKGLKSPSHEYFHNHVLSITEDITDVGEVKWQLALCLLLAWVLVCICLAKGIKTSGKAVYFTAFFPYIVLLILLVRGLTLPGSVNGILYFITPKWELLMKAKVWGDAAVQIFFSLSPCWGGLITLASYNKFNNNCLKDAVVVSILDCLTSIFAGLVIFTIIGYMAHQLNQPIDEVAVEGAGLAFIVYPEVVTRLPVSPLWAILFFLMLITLGLGTQIATVTTVHTTLMDQFPHIFRKSNRSFYLLLLISFIFFIVGLAFCTQGGMYVLQLFDNYAGTYSLLIIGLSECIALSWFYGADRFLDDIKLMLGKRPHKMWKYAWKYLSPAALCMIIAFTWIDFQPTEYAGNVFPTWADVVGWSLTLVSVAAIPTVAIIQIVTEKRKHGRPLLDTIKALVKPRSTWGPTVRVVSTMRQDSSGTETKILSMERDDIGYESACNIMTPS